MDDFTFHANAQLARAARGELMARGTRIGDTSLPAPSSCFLAALSGPSMHPTLTDRDILKVEPYADRMPQVGDVIWFNVPGQASAIIHRIVSRDAESIRTRGDNNTFADPWPILRHDIEGKVIGAWRGPVHRRIHGGRMGVYRARSIRFRKGLATTLLPPCMPLYDSLTTRGFPARFLPSLLRPKVKIFVSGDGKVQLMVCERVAGWYDRSSTRWIIRRWARLVVHESQLPTVPEPP